MTGEAQWADRATGTRQRITFVDAASPLFCSIVEPLGQRLATLVACPPLLVDFAHSYRREAEMAKVLAARGVAVVRFHYRGTGSSGGNPAEMTFATLVEDANRVINFARSEAAAPLAVLGTRAGAMVAAAAASRAGGLPVAMWRPVETGGAYLREGFRARMIADQGQLGRTPPTSAELRQDLRRQGSVDLVGWALHQGLYDSLVGLRLLDLLEPCGPAEVLLLRSAPPDDIAAVDHLPAALCALGMRVETAEVGLFEGWWFLRTHRSPPDQIGEALADAIDPWIRSVPTQDIPAPAGITHDPGRAPAGDTDHITETSVFITSGANSVFGLLTPPALPANGVAVLVLWGGGGIPLFGKNQVAARLARGLATMGYRVLRIDYPGCGESSGRTTPEPIDEAGKNAVFAAAEAAYRRLLAEGYERIVVVGSCQGAVAALVAAARVPAPAGLVLLAPPVRIEGDTFCRDQPTGPEDRTSRRLLDGVEDAVDRGIPLMIAYGTEDEGYPEYLEALSGALGDTLRRAGDRATLIATKERIHGNLTVAGQDATVDLVCGWLANADYQLRAPADHADGPAPDPIAERVRAYLVATRPGARDLFQGTGEVALVDAGILDSVAVYSLVAFLEEAFGVEIPDEDLSWDHFRSVDAIATLVRARECEAGAIGSHRR